MLEILQIIVDTVAVILGGTLMLRFWMQAIRVRPPPQISQVTFTLTDWLVRPLRRVIPGVGGFDWASLIGALLVVMLATSLYLLGNDSVAGVAKFGLYRFLSWILYGLSGLLILEVIFSWINPNAPMAPFVRALNEPLVRHLRRVIPTLGGMDLSMLVALLLLLIGRVLLRMLFGYP